jgi:hypothetical protein
VAQPLIVAMPSDLVLSGGYKIAVTAVNPTTGATVAGVQVQNVAFEVDIRSSGGEIAGDILLAVPTK